MKPKERTVFQLRNGSLLFLNDENSERPLAISDHVILGRARRSQSTCGHGDGEIERDFENLGRIRGKELDSRFCNGSLRMDAPRTILKAIILKCAESGEDR